MVPNRVLPVLAALVLALTVVEARPSPPKKVKNKNICPDGVNTAKNKACCVLFPIVEDLTQNYFENECGDNAHGALRLLFHDAIGISPRFGGGGADGSISTFNVTELSFPANLGIQDILEEMNPYLFKYAGVLSPGDFIQLAGAVSLVQCPGAPRVPYYLGRPPPVAPAPPGLVPEPFDSIASIVERFGEVGFNQPADIVAIVAGAHSIGGADDIVPDMQGLPFDSTPSLFDTQIFVEVQLHGTMYTGLGGQQGEVETAVAGTVRLQSDSLLARDPSTTCAWQSYANNQEALVQDFANGILKLSLLGQDSRKLIDCSEVIPDPIGLTSGPATFPPGLNQNDIDQTCPTVPFPPLGTQQGPPITVPPIPQSNGSDG